MTDLAVERLILGDGIIGSYLANRFEDEKIKFAILDIASEVDSLMKATSTHSNINSNLAKHRNSFRNTSGLVWGRGLMMIPENEYLESTLPVDLESLRKSISTIVNNFLSKEIIALETYQSGENTFIDTLCIPRRIHDRFFYKDRDVKYKIYGQAAYSISPTKSGYKVKAVNPRSGKTLEIHTKEVFITLGALESVRLLLNSRELFDGKETNIGRNLSDHVSMETASISSSEMSTLKHLSPRNRMNRIHPRFMHQPIGEAGLGGFSFIDFDPKAKKSSLRDKLLRRASGYELSPGKSIAKTLLETEKSDAAFMELRPTSNDLIPDLHLEFNVSDKFITDFRFAANQFVEHLRSLNINSISDFDMQSISLQNMFDSLHPTGVIPFLDKPELGEFGADFQLHNHPGIYCFSTGMLPRAFSVQPTLTIMAFAEIYLTHSYGVARS